MHTPVAFSEFKNSCAFLSSGAKRAAVFVHGYGGSSTGTWPYFSTLVDFSQFAENWRQTDLFFYDYRSTKYDLLDHAFAFKKFLTTVFPRPNWQLLSPAPQPRAPVYDDLILVGHSTGAIIIRKALWLIRDDAVNEDEANEYLHLADNPFFISKLRLFAPALLGTQFSGWKAILLGIPSLESLFRNFAFKSRVLQTLTVNRESLQTLRRQTEENAGKYPELYAFRARVLFGKDEDVVAKEAYKGDYLEEPVPLRTHISICKPTRNFPKPMEFVLYDARGASR